MELSRALGLNYEQQDWGIVNADASRLEEFIVYYNEHAALSPMQRFELGQLVLASANEALLKSADAALPFFLNFLRQHAKDFLAELEYWEALDSAREFPLTVWLRTNYTTTR